MSEEKYHNYYKKLFLSPERVVFEIAKSRRQQQTVPEKILWEYLRNKKLKGYKFRRQHVLDKYIADFYCPAKKLVIELDGKYHNDLDQVESDDMRTRFLDEKNIKVIRLNNKLIFNNLKKVLQNILSELEKR